MVTDKSEKGEFEELEYDRGTGKSLDVGSLNNTQWLSNNEPDLPSVKTGLQGAANGDVLAISPGSHDTPGQIDITSDVTILWLGQLNLTDSTATEVIDAEQQVHIIPPGIVQGGQKAITSSVSDSAVGIRIHKTSSTAGPMFVGDVGSHGVFFEQREADDNTNGSDMVFSVSNVSGDGVRVENTTGDAPNLNAMYIRVSTVFGSGGHGLNAISGFDNAFELLNVEANDQPGVRHAVSDRNHYRITHAEVNDKANATALDFVADADFAAVESCGDINYTLNTGSNHYIEPYGNMTTARIKSGSTGIGGREVMVDKTNGRLVFSDGSGNRWYVSGTAF
jgi:hypothetical protein